MNQEFPTLEAAKDWILTQELDQIYSLTHVRQGNGVYRCRHCETPGKTRVKKNLDPTKDHVKRNWSKITALSCKARFYLRKITRCKCLDNVSEKCCLHQQTLFELRGSLKHSHEVERKFRLLFQVSKNLIMSLLEAGVPRSVIRDKYCRPSHMEDSDAKWVTLKDLTNFENALNKSRHPPEPSASVPCAQLDLAISSMTSIQVCANSKVNLPDKLDGLPFSINADPASLNLTSQDGKSGTDFSCLALSDPDLLDSTSTQIEMDTVTRPDLSLDLVPEVTTHPKKDEALRPAIDFNWIELAASSKVSKFDQPIPLPFSAPMTPQEFERKLSKVLVELGHRVRQDDLDDQPELLGRLEEINNIAKSKMKIGKRKKNVRSKPIVLVASCHET